MKKKENAFKSVRNVSVTVTASSNSADDHLKSAASEKNFYVCKICPPIRIPSSDALDFHLRSFHVTRRSRDCYPCGNYPCDKKFPTSALLVNHLRLEHTEQKNCSCGRCGKKFTHPHSVPTHCASNPPSKVHCNLCALELEKAKGKDVEVIHVENNKENALKSVPNNNNNPNSNNVGRTEAARSEGEMDSRICQICQLGFTSPDVLDDHLKSLHVVTRFSCGSCGREFETLEILMDHLRRDHTVQNFKACGQCGQKLTCRQSLSTHSGNESSKVYCDLCTEERQNENSQAVEVVSEKSDEEKAAKPVQNVSENIIASDPDVDELKKARSDDIIDSYVCQLCQLGLSSSDALDDHLRSLHVVDSGKSFSCGSCDKSFQTSALLVDHLRRNHSVQKIHSCGQCGEKFTHCHSVPTHKRRFKPLNIYCGLCLMEKSRNKAKKNVLKENNRGRKIVTSKRRKRRSDPVKIGESSYYGCEFCREVLTSLPALKRHTRLIHTETPYHCEYCWERFRNPHALIRHSRVEHDTRYTCYRCMRRFSCEYTMRKHRLKHAWKGVHLCRICGGQFLDRENLHTHYLAHFLNSNHTFGLTYPVLADRNLQSTDNIPSADHKTDEKETTTLSNRNRKRNVRKFACGTCSKKFWNREALLNHERNHCGENPYSCKVCGKNFTSARNLKRHCLIHSGEKPFVCETCGRGFTQKACLTVHKRMHTGEKPYKCITCDKEFAQKQYLKNHFLKHSGAPPRKPVRQSDRKFSCDICAKEYSTRTGLYHHKRTHTDVKPYPCEVCDKKFRNRAQWCLHMRTHSGERPYLCETCGKGFAQQQQLVSHQRTHTGEKPYECDICRRAFSQKYVLVHHRRVHTGERPFQCDICQKGFIYKGQMKKHRLTHSVD